MSDYYKDRNPYSRQPYQDEYSGKKKSPPAIDTYAEVFYYKKQIDAHTLMVAVLHDGEEIEGTIEWYDREVLKINRKDAPNVLLLKHNIKYLYKAEERVSVEKNVKSPKAKK
jgi:sRNA-binding regulator protein Hfq